MMFLNLKPLPNEHVFSWLLRSYLLSGTVNFFSFQSQVNIDATKLYANQVFGSNFEDVLQFFGHRQELIVNHTNALLWQVSVGELVSSKQSSLDSFEHMNEQQFFGHDTSWHACEHCIKEDMERYGISYWHAEHQYPSVFTCFKHLKPLLFAKEPVKNIYFEVLPQNVTTWDRVAPEASQSLIGWQCYLKEVIDLCHTNSSCIAQIRPKIIKHFNIEKYKQREQKLVCERLNLEFEQAMGNQLLQYLFRDYSRANLRGKTNVFSILLINHFKSSGVRNPIYWLAVAYWLKISKQLDVLS